MGSLRSTLGIMGSMMLALTPACVASDSLDSSSAEDQDDALSAYISGITAIDAQNSADAAALLDGQASYSAKQWASTNIYDASKYPMRAVFNLGKTYDVSEVGLFHGNGTGTLDVKYLPVGADSTKDASYKLVEAHPGSVWNAWETVKQTGTFRTQYIEITVTSAATLPNYSEIRVAGTAVGGTPPPPPPPPGHIVSKVGTGEYQSWFLVDGKLYGLGMGEISTGFNGQSKGVPLPLDVPAGTTFVDMQAGLHQNVAVDSNGHVWGWGTNGNGVGGLGTVGGDEIGKATMIPQDASGHAFDHVIAVSSRINQNWALKSDGTMWFWGNCSNGSCGLASRPSAISRPTQVPLPSGVKIVRFSTSTLVLALASDGSVYSWGNVGGYANQMNVANGTDGSTPAKVIGLPSNIAQVVTGGDFNYAVTAAGDLWGWGVRPNFMALDEDQPIKPELLDIGLRAKVKAIGANDETTHVVLTDGSLWGWGANGQGEVGNLNAPDYHQTNLNYGGWGGVEVMVTTPQHIAPNVTNFAKVFANPTFAFYTYAETADGQLYFMGRNKNGIAGDGIYPGAASGSYYAASDVCASFPNSWDVTLAKKVSPMTLTVGTPTLSPYCVAHPNVAPCNNK